MINLAFVVVFVWNPLFGFELPLCGLYAFGDVKVYPPDLVVQSCMFLYFINQNQLEKKGVSPNTPLTNIGPSLAIGEEPLGIRVTPYHKPSCISKTLSALDDENEVAVIRE